MLQHQDQADARVKPPYKSYNGQPTRHHLRSNTRPTRLLEALCITRYVDQPCKLAPGKQLANGNNAPERLAHREDHQSRQ
ncbi:unnamed protein product [Fusarium venenatum]|uniref:Uncharacterized protein n=1 Tax=Fusarium venenatum TaxID=56646 RepID=A0A2L2TGP4_9HYPO|nr:uncharacterized protein FVRRES_03695 [Fusarium venenatum]CEI67183.1 unnamed protein product [Fusarium venenatum]